ncbi:MAG: cytochrome b/b6 [Pseudomonadota bacterium]
MAHESTYKPTTGFGRWMDSRLPIPRLVHDQFVVFPAPRNLNYLWTFGAILSFLLVAQIATGIVLAMHYQATTADAFNSIEKIMRDVNWGWLLRYAHAVGASMFFLAAYIHMFRGLYYGSYKAPREILWMLGCLIFLLMIATAFMGYSLVWGQMSFWAVTVITNLFSSLDSVIPGFGTMLVQWIWGGFSVGEPTLNRLFSLHYLFPFIIAGVVFLHVWALHIPGSNNPTGVDVKAPSDTLSFHPYFTIKDGFAAVVFFILFAGLVFYAPNYLGHSDNYIPADPLVTPAHIVPEWYFLPFYAILRAIPDKLMGVIAMFASIAVLFVIPWLDTSRIRSVSYRPIFKWFFWLFVISCLALGYLGAQVAEGWYVFFSRVFTVYYFAFFLIVMPIVGLIEKPKRLPGSITESVLGPKAASSAPATKSKPAKESGGHALPGRAAAAAEGVA